MAKRATIAGVKKAMTALGVYKPEFDGAIARYVEMRKEYIELYGRYTDADFPCVVDSPSGPKKNPLLTSIENLRKEMAAQEIALGLNPVGLMKLNPAAFADEKKPDESWMDGVDE